MEYPFSDKYEASDPSVESPVVPAERNGTFSVAGDVSQKILVDDFAQATQDLLMESSSPDRASAARKLAKFGKSSAVPYLIAALSDNSQEVRLAAAESLGQLGDSSTIGHLKDLLTRQYHSEMEERIVAAAIHSIATRERELLRTPPVETSLKNEPQSLVQPIETNLEENDRISLSSEPEIYPCTLVEPPLTAEIQTVSQDATELIDRLDDAQARLAVLEQLRVHAEAKVCERAEREIRLQAEIKALRETGEAQLKRIEEAEAEERRLAKEQIHLQASTEARRKTDAEDRQRAATEMLQQLEDEARLRAENQEQMLEHLETIRAKAEAAAGRRTEKERLLNSQLLAFSEAAAEQLKRIEKAETDVSEAEEALQQVQERARQTAEQVAVRLAEVEKRRQLAAEQQAQADEEARALAEKENQRLAELEGIRALAEAEAKKRAETERQLNNEIETLRTAEAIQKKRIEDLQVEVERMSKEATRLIRIAEQEEKRLVDLESLRGSTETEPQSSGNEVLLTAEIPQAAEVGVSKEGSDTRIGSITNVTETLPKDLQSVSPNSETASTIVENGDQNDARSVAEDEMVSPESVASSVDVFDPSTLQNTTEQSGKPTEATLSEEGIKVPTEQSPIATSLAECFRTGNPADRAAALQELAQLDQNSVFTLITGLFDNSSEAVRNAAARALYDLSSDRAQTFTRALQEASPERRLQIIRALDSSGLAEAAIDNLAGESREKTQDAFSLLYLMSQAGEIQTLLEAIEKHPNSPVRLSVIKLLSFSNRPDIIPSLRRLAVRGALPIEVRSALMALIYEMSSVARERSLSAA